MANKYLKKIIFFSLFIITDAIFASPPPPPPHPCPPNSNAPECNTLPLGPELTVALIITAVAIGIYFIKKAESKRKLEEV